ncbi:hypothetical protein M885DRAFT_600474, partial [Pelagophyceae sp. CCMP2097]
SRLSEDVARVVLGEDEAHERCVDRVDARARRRRVGVADARRRRVGVADARRLDVVACLVRALLLLLELNLDDDAVVRRLGGVVVVRLVVVLLLRRFTKFHLQVLVPEPRVEVVVLLLRVLLPLPDEALEVRGARRQVLAAHDRTEELDQLGLVADGERRNGLGPVVLAVVAEVVHVEVGRDERELGPRGLNDVVVVVGRKRVRPDLAEPGAPLGVDRLVRLPGRLGHVSARNAARHHRADELQLGELAAKLLVPRAGVRVLERRPDVRLGELAELGLIPRELIHEERHLLVHELVVVLARGAVDAQLVLHDAPEARHRLGVRPGLLVVVEQVPYVARERHVALHHLPAVLRVGVVEVDVIGVDDAEHFLGDVRVLEALQVLELVPVRLGLDHVRVEARQGRPLEAAELDQLDHGPDDVHELRRVGPPLRVRGERLGHLGVEVVGELGVPRRVGDRRLEGGVQDEHLGDDQEVEAEARVARAQRAHLAVEVVDRVLFQQGPLVVRARKLLVEHERLVEHLLDGRDLGDLLEEDVAAVRDARRRRQELAGLLEEPPRALHVLGRVRDDERRVAAGVREVVEHVDDRLGVEGAVLVPAFGQVARDVHEAERERFGLHRDGRDDVHEGLAHDRRRVRGHGHAVGLGVHGPLVHRRLDRGVLTVEHRAVDLLAVRRRPRRRREADRFQVGLERRARKEARRDRRVLELQARVRLVAVAGLGALEVQVHQADDLGLLRRRAAVARRAGAARRGGSVVRR